MKDIFRVAAGTVTGAAPHHMMCGNQDRSFIKQNEDVTVAVVCDGCSDGEHSEVGASLAAAMLGNGVLAVVGHHSRPFDPRWPINWPWFTWDHCLAALDDLAGRLTDGNNEQLRAVVRHYFLFTAIVVVITREITQIVHCGDGFASLNGEVLDLGKSKKGTPPYIGYGLLPGNDTDPRWQFKVLASKPTSAVDEIMIGSDGVDALVNSASKPIPGGASDRLVGSVDQFFDDAYFENEFAIGRRLSLIQYGVRRPGGRMNACLLPDDTTIVSIRRST